MEKRKGCKILREKDGCSIYIFFDPRVCYLADDAAGDYSKELVAISERARFESHTACTVDSTKVEDGIIHIWMNPAVALNHNLFSVDDVITQVISLVGKASAHK